MRARAVVGWRAGRRWRYRLLRRWRVERLEGYVVIVSYGRSGTTVLQRLFNAVDGVCLRGEHAGATIHLERAHRMLRNAVDAHGSRAAMPADSPWYGIELTDLRALRRGLRRLVYRHILHPTHHTRVGGFKEIRYTSEYFTSLDELVEHLVFLDVLMPGVRYVVNVRDVEATAHSGWWKAHPRAHAVLTESRAWLEAVPDRLNAHFGAPRALLVRYEQWSADPDQVAAILGYCGLTLPRAEIVALLSERLEHMAHWTPGS